MNTHQKREPLRIMKTFIRYFPHSDRYRLETEDQYGRWWSYRGVGALSLDEAEEIEAEECRKGILNLKLYWFDDDRIVKKIKRQEDIMYVYRLNKYGYYGEEFDPDNGAQIMIITNDGLRYVHDKIFYNYEQLKELALKIIDKGSVNLEFWTCEGTFEWDMDTSYLNEFIEKTYYEEQEEWTSCDIYNSLGGEDGERKYMSDGAWISPDGTITFDR